MNEQVSELSREEFLERYAKKPSAAAAPSTRRSPFKFLDAYSVDDADIFFGRDSEIEELLRHFHSYGHVLIYGESGAGKSSLVQCGLRSRIPEADALFISLRVHTTGLPTLGYQICESASDHLGEPVEISRELDLVDTLQAVREAASRPLVLFFDQFEELFIFHDAEIRRRFAYELAAIHEARLNIKVIIGVRQDYLAQLSELEETVEGVFDNRFWLRRMSREHAAEAVVKACATCEVAIDADLAQTIIHRLDPAGHGIELPYLQVVMDRLYRQAVDDNPAQPVITEDAVGKLGDIGDILGSFLVEEVAKLPSPDTGRQILKAFVTREGTRRNLDRAGVTHEAAGFGETISPAELDVHLNQLANVRILREIADTDSFELRHDALAETVESWISEVEKELVEVRDNLVNRFKEYEARGQPEEALLDQGFLDYLAVYQHRLSPLLDDALHGYVDKSRQRLGTKKRIKRLVIGGSVLFAVVIGLAMFWYYVARINEEREVAVAAEITATQAATRANDEATKAKAQLSRSQRLLYVNHIQSAQLEWKAGNPAAAWEHLNACLPELHGWEYHYLHGMFTKNHKTLQGHTSFVRAVDVSPDGRRIVSGSYDHTLILWDAGTGEQIMTLQGHSGVVSAVAFSPDGSRIASASRDNTLKLWDAKTGETVSTLEGHADSVTAVAFSPDGNRVISGSEDNLMKLWDANTGEELMNFEGHTASVNAVAFSPDGNRIVSGSEDRSLELWDAGTGEELMNFEGHTASVNTVAFSPDGSQIVSGSNDQTLKLWDAKSGESTVTFKGHTSQVYSVAFSSIGIISGGRDDLLKLWDGKTGQEIITLKGHTSTVYGVAFFPDSNRIVTASRDNTLKLWDGRRGPDKLTLKGHTDPVHGVAYSPDGRRIVSGSRDNTLKLWDVGSREETMTLEGHTARVVAVAFSPDGSRIVSGSDDGTLRLWPAKTVEEAFVLRGHTDAVMALAFSPDGSRIVSGSVDKTLRLWDVRTGEETRVIKGHTTPIYAVAFSPDGRRVVSGGGVREEIVELRVWDGAAGEQTLQINGHTDVVTALAFNREGNCILSASNDNTLRLWNASTGEQKLVLKGHTDIVTCMAFSPDESRIVSGSRDNTLKLWDPRTGEEMLTLKGHSGSVWALDFRSDGRQIVSASSDGTLKLWNAKID